MPRATLPPPQRPLPARDLVSAVTLRPRDVFALYGIPASTLSELATHPDASRRPPSRLIRGRGSRKGIRLFPRAAFDAWLSRWDESGNYQLPAGSIPPAAAPTASAA